MVAIPASRLGDAFVTLSIGLAGAIVQRLQNHGCGLAVLGDVGAMRRPPRASAHSSRSQTGGRANLLLAADAADLRRRLQARGA